MRELIAVILLLMIFATGKADEPISDINTNMQNETPIYYVNPDGGTRYHTRRDCPSISEEYHAGMVAYAADALPQGLKSCPICGAPELATPTPDVSQVCYYVNPDGGTRYHTRRDCPSISEEYHAGMVAYAADDLPQELTECKICKGDAANETVQEIATQSAMTAGTYIVGADIPQGLYGFTCDENASGTVKLYAWDGSVIQSWQVYAGFQETATLYNEQRLELPQGCQAVWHLAFATSAYDTGTRNLRLNEAGIYQEGVDLAAGLYIVQNDEDANASVSLLNSEDGALLQSWSVEPGVMITLYVREECSVQITEGCLLRSMTTKWIMQEGQQESIVHGRYSTMMQLPRRNYTVIGQDDDAYVKVTNLQQNETVTYALSKGETLQLDLRSYDGTEYLVEFMHVDVSWKKADG